MKYSVKWRTRKVNRLIFNLIFRIILYKIYRPFLPNKLKSENLNNVHSKIANLIVSTLLDLEGLFIKVGQLMSTFSSILPEPYVTALKRTQDHSVERPFEEIREVLETELNKPVNQVFKFIETKALGSASIGQVHKAVLLSGELVAIKVQHKNIVKIAALDLKLIKKILNFVQYIITIKGVDSSYDEIVKMVSQELDYEHEAQQINLISALMRNDNRVVIPTVFEAYSNKRILVMEYMDGNKITDKAYVSKHRLNHNTIATNLVDVFSKSILLDGVYHADPHPGNLMLNKEGQIILLDFGAIGILDDRMKEGFFILLQAIFFKDENLMISGFKKMGFISDHPEVNIICKNLIKILGDYLIHDLKLEKFNLNEIDLDKINVSKILQLIKKINFGEIQQIFKVPKDWVLLNRSLTLLIGVTSEISPQLDIYKVVKPNVFKMILKKDNLRLFVRSTLQDQLNRLITLPRKIDLFLEEVENGLVEVKIKDRKHEIKLFYSLGQQLVFIIVTGMTYFFYTIDNQIFFGYLSIGAFSLFLLSFMNSLIIKRRIK